MYSIGDNGDYLFCQSMHDFNYWKEEYKKGVRTSNGVDDSLKLSNGKYAEDQETKEAFEGYMSKVDNYNEQVASGEKPDVKMGDLLNEYSDWRNFLKVLNKAKAACENSEFNVDEQLVEVNKLSKRNNNANVNIQDYKLSRYMCYLIVQNADPSKKVVALGKTYFAIQTRK